jgi:hypothetical protein
VAAGPVFPVFFARSPLLSAQAEELNHDLLWTDFSLCVSSSAISQDATDAQAVAFRGKKKVLKLRENKPLSHYRRVLENCLYVNLVENSALDHPPADQNSGTIRKALPPLPKDSGTSPAGPRKPLPEAGGLDSAAAKKNFLSSSSPGPLESPAPAPAPAVNKSERSQSAWVSAKAPSTRIQVFFRKFFFFFFLIFSGGSSVVAAGRAVAESASDAA